MIKYVYGTDLWLYPNLAHSMFRHRAIQFSERLKWEVDVDTNGYERDQYDSFNPVYVIVEDDLGCHGGSMRLLPTIGRTMINEHFSGTLRNTPVHDPEIWECTRFCLSPSAQPRTAEKVFASTGRLTQELNITSVIAVFDRLMLRKYRVSGVAPEVLGECDYPSGKIMAGRWRFDQTKLNEIMALGVLDPFECELALVNSPFVEKVGDHSPNRIGPVVV